MDAFETLRSTSQAASGADAWTHLNSQGGGDIHVGPVLGANVDQTAAADVTLSLSANIDIETYMAEADTFLSADVSQETLEAELCQP